MKYIRKLWIRILLSLFLGAFLAELVHVKTGNSSPELSNIILWLGAIVSFSLLSFIVWLDKYRYYFFLKDSETKTDSKILDDLD